MSGGTTSMSTSNRQLPRGSKAGASTPALQRMPSYTAQLS
jgi:hypothetical protein